MFALFISFLAASRCSHHRTIASRAWYGFIRRSEQNLFRKEKLEEVALKISAKYNLPAS